MTSSTFMFGPLKCSTHSRQELLAEIKALLADPTDRPRTINCLNAHIFNLAWKNRRLVKALNNSRIVAADGMSIVWASVLFKNRLRERCNMTEAFRDFMSDSSFPNCRAILVGGDVEIAQDSALSINRTCSHTKVIDSVSGYLSKDEYEAYFRECDRVDFVLLGLGTPKSEHLSEFISNIHPESIVWHIGGGTILFLADRLPEAPEWMRHIGLQWLHRLYLEPRRMWKRYLLGNFIFLIRVFSCLFGGLRRISHGR